MDASRSAQPRAERDASIFLTLQEERAKVQVRVTPENR